MSVNVNSHGQIGCPRRQLSTRRTRTCDSNGYVKLRNTATLTYNARLLPSGWLCVFSSSLKHDPDAVYAVCPAGVVRVIIIIIFFKLLTLLTVLCKFFC